MKKIVLFLVCMIMLSAVSVYGAQSSSASIKITLLNQDPDPASAGNTVTLRFKVENTGGEAVDNLNLELIQDYPFTVINGDAVKNLGSLGAYQSGNNYLNFEYTIKIDKDVVEGTKALRVRYQFNNGVSTTESFSVNIASKQFAQIIYIDKAKLAPGKETDMNFTIVNVGNAALQNMLFSWQEPNGVILPVYSSDTKYVKYLDVGASVDLSYKVIADVNAKPGLYQLTLSLSSESLTGSSTSVVTTKAGIFVGGETDFDVAFSESSAGQTSLSVSNIGNNPAQSVSVVIPQQQIYRVSGTNSVIVGNLDKGDYTLVSFQISSAANVSGQRGQGFNQTQLTQDQLQQRLRQNINNSISGQNIGGRQNFSGQDNNLKVLIQYTDTTGERRSVEKSVPIQFRSSTGQSGTTGTNGFGRTTQSSSFIGSTAFWVLIAVVAIILIWVFSNKSRRQRIFSFGKKR